ncbi:MAG: rhomboid family intramembrane serine protease [Candidatus Bipolaricaulia bacterium]
MIPLRDYRPSGSVPYVSLALIILNGLIFLYQQLLSSQVVATPFGRITKEELFILTYGLRPYEFIKGADLWPAGPSPLWIGLFTSMFLHGGIAHIGGNMLYLWIFGDNVEGAMGHFKFLAFYLVCGALAALAQVAISPKSTTPIIGASGAIAGVLGAYLMLFPYSRILTLIFFFFFIRIVTLPALLILGLWFIYQLLLAPTGLGPGGGVAFFAHIGGFLAGALLVYIFKKSSVEIQLFRRRYY